MFLTTLYLGRASGSYRHNGKDSGYSLLSQTATLRRAMLSVSPGQEPRQGTKPSNPSLPPRLSYVAAGAEMPE